MADFRGRKTEFTGQEKDAFSSVTVTSDRQKGGHRLLGLCRSMSSWDQRHPPTYKILKILENLKSEKISDQNQPPYQRQVIGEGRDAYGAKFSAHMTI